MASEEEDLKLVCTPDIVFHTCDASETASTSLSKNRAEVMDMCPQMMGLGVFPVSKRKHKVLSLENKIEILKKIEAGESISSLSKVYDIGRATIFDIKAKKDSIMSFASSLKDGGVLKTRKTLRKPSKKLKNLFKDSFSTGYSNSSRGGSDSPSCGSDNVQNCDSTPATAENSDLNLNNSDLPCKTEPLPDSANFVSCGGGFASGRDTKPGPKEFSPQIRLQSAGVSDITPFDFSHTIHSTKRKHVVLSIETKIEILQRLDNGETGTSLAPLYNVGRATISDIKNKRDSILMFASKLKSGDGLKKRKTMRKANDTSLENAVFMWYVQEVNRGESVNGPKICEKALELNSKLGGPPDFKASTGWLKNFRSRHGIKCIQGEKERFTYDASAGYLDAYLNLLQQEGYHPDDIYSADETIIDWQTMPRNSVVFGCRQEELDANEPLTVLLCANSSWNHALPLLVIGKRNMKDVFKHISCFPVVYRRQRNGWMDSALFMSWFANNFIPAVKKEREKTGRYGKVLLLLDNAPFHPVVEMLNRVDDTFKVMFLPSNLTASVHPMQTAIQSLKRLFKTNILRRLLLAQDDEQSVIKCVENLTLKECCHMLADIWNSLSRENKKSTSDKPWGVSETSSPDESYDIHLQEVFELFAKVPGFSSCTIMDACEWLAIDADDPGNRILDMDEIVTLVQNDESADGDLEDDCEYPEDEQKLPNYEGPSHAEAYRAFETIMGWCEQRRDCCPEELIFLKRLRDLAVKKSWVSSGSKF